MAPAELMTMRSVRSYTIQLSATMCSYSTLFVCCHEPNGTTPCLKTANSSRSCWLKCTCFGWRFSAALHGNWWTRETGSDRGRPRHRTATRSIVDQPRTCFMYMCLSYVIPVTVHAKHSYVIHGHCVSEVGLENMLLYVVSYRTTLAHRNVSILFRNRN